MRERGSKRATFAQNHNIWTHCRRHIKTFGFLLLLLSSPTPLSISAECYVRCICIRLFAVSSFYALCGAPPVGLLPLPCLLLPKQPSIASILFSHRRHLLRRRRRRLRSRSKEEEAASLPHIFCTRHSPHHRFPCLFSRLHPSPFPPSDIV